MLLGLGVEEKLTVERLRNAYSVVAKACQKLGLVKITLVLPNIVELRHVSVDECLRGIAEGILLSNYTFEQLATSSDRTVLLKSVQLVGITSSKLDVVRLCEEIAEGVYFARDLVNKNADDITPTYLGKAASKLAKTLPNLKAEVFGRKWIQSEKLGLLEAVSRGAQEEPAFIILSYRGYARSKDHTVIVGKGVTYDTGGLNLKPTGSIETMRSDMAGAAAALATVTTAAALKMKVNVTAVIPSTENAIDSKSYKPGDVYAAYNKTTVEIGNTDAEGRLILADALAYTLQNLKPTRMIDVATLTGAVVVALGEDMAGLYCNDETLSKQLLDASQETGEKVWRLPLHEPYKELLKSDIADLRNIGGRAGGSITAALFLEAFVGSCPWAHFDIAGPAFTSKEHGYQPKNGVGFGVRTLLNFLQKLA